MLQFYNNVEERGTISFHSKKFQVQLRNENVPGIKYITTVKHQKKKNALTKDHGELQTQSPQRLDDGYKHTSGLNDRWTMRLKLIQEEYFYIEI